MSIRAIKWVHSILPVVDLPPTERLTLLVLAFHHNDRTNECFPAISTLSDEVGVGQKRQREAINTLVDWRLIQKRRGGTASGNASNRYTLFGNPKRPKQTAPRPPVSERFKPPQKSRFETAPPVPVSNRPTGDDDRGYTSERENPSQVVRVNFGGHHG